MKLIPDRFASTVYPTWAFGLWNSVVGATGRARRALWRGSALSRLFTSDVVYADTTDDDGAITGPTPLGLGRGIFPGDDGNVTVILPNEDDGDQALTVAGTTYGSSNLTGLKQGQSYRITHRGVAASGTTIGQSAVVSAYRDPIGSMVGVPAANPSRNYGPWRDYVSFLGETKAFYNQGVIKTVPFNTDLDPVPRTLMVSQDAEVRVSMRYSDFFVSRNLLDDPSDFTDATVWGHNRVTISADVTQAPHEEGAVPERADAVVANTADGTHGIIQPHAITAGDDIVARVYVKTKEIRAVRLRCDIGASHIYQDFNIVNAVKIGDTVSSNDARFVKSDIVALMDDWMVISVQGVVSAEGTTALWSLSGIHPHDGISFLGNGTDSFYAWNFRAGPSGFLVRLASGEQHIVRPYRIHSIGTTANTVIKAIG